MTEKLVIQKFGPIKEAQLEIRDITILVGPQATGKSITSQLLFFMSEMNDILFRSNREGLELEKRIENALAWWLGNNAATYINPGSFISWTTPDGKNEYRIIWDSQKKILINESLSAEIRRWNEVPLTLALPQQVYIPSGRSLFTFLPPWQILRFVSSPSGFDWPGYILRFYENLGKALSELSKSEMNYGKGWAGVSLYLEMIEPLVEFVQSRINSILKGQIEFNQNGEVVFKVKRKILNLKTIAAGQMEIWPFWAILNWELRAWERNFNTLRFYIEEPEAHLHPAAQRAVMDIITATANSQERYIITTHSPYILYALNNELMAHKVVSAGKQFPKNKSAFLGLDPDKVAAYRFTETGKVVDIMDREVGLIDENELDYVADQLGASFSSLQNQILI